VVKPLFLLSLAALANELQVQKRLLCW